MEWREIRRLITDQRLSLLHHQSTKRPTTCPATSGTVASSWMLYQSIFPLSPAPLQDDDYDPLESFMAEINQEVAANKPGAAGPRPDAALACDDVADPAAEYMEVRERSWWKLGGLVGVGGKGPPGGSKGLWGGRGGGWGVSWDVRVRAVQSLGGGGEP